MESDLRGRLENARALYQLTDDFEPELRGYNELCLTGMKRSKKEVAEKTKDIEGVLYKVTSQNTVDKQSTDNDVITIGTMLYLNLGMGKLGQVQVILRELTD